MPTRSQDTHPNSSQTQLVLLGTGTPNAEPDRRGPALAIVVGDVPYLVDCGPGVVRQAAAAHERGVAGLAVEKLSRLFVTHLHSDHALGLPDLLLTPAVLGRPGPLEAFGPPGLAHMTEHLLAAYDQDIRLRVEGFERGNAAAYSVNVHEIEPGVAFEDERVRVTAFAVEHAGWQHAFGYKFESADRTIVVSGDTVPHPNVVEHARGCDILLHEVYSTAGFARLPRRWQEYHAQAHTSSKQLADIARAAQPTLLVLTHLLLWGATEEELLAEIRDHYDGEVRCGRDLDVY